MVGHQAGDLGDREHEDQVEEQLEVGDPVVVLGPRDRHARRLPGTMSRFATT
jgi:hypothetical protein